MPKMPYEQCEDEALAALARGGDEMALEQIFHRYRDVIRGKANLYFMVGGDKDDMIQEGMIGLFWAIMNYDVSKEASFATFADLCVSRQMITAAKRAGRLKHRPLNTSVSLNSNPDGNSETVGAVEEILADNSDGPEEILLMKDDLEQIVRDSLRMFSKLELEVWNAYIQGNTYTEIAKSLGKPPKTIDNAIQRMKKKVLKTIAN